MVLQGLYFLSVKNTPRRIFPTKLADITSRIMRPPPKDTMPNYRTKNPAALFHTLVAANLVVWLYAMIPHV